MYIIKVNLAIRSCCVNVTSNEKISLNLLRCKIKVLRFVIPLFDHETIFIMFNSYYSQ